MRTVCKAIGVSALAAAALLMGLVSSASAAEAPQRAPMVLSDDVAASAGLAATVLAPAAEPIRVADSRSRRRAAGVAVGVAAVVGAAIIASQAARADNRPRERYVDAPPRYEGPSRYQCRRWLRDCDDGARWACRRHDREC